MLLSLLTHAELVTPNIPEAALLSGRSLQETIADPERTIAKLHQLGIQNILLKGGHLDSQSDIKTKDQVIDYFSDGQQIYPLPHQKIHTKPQSGKAFHGTGCILASAITAYAARGFNLLTAIKQAKAYLLQTMQNAADIGKGALLL